MDMNGAPTDEFPAMDMDAAHYVVVVDEQWTSEDEDGSVWL